MSIVDIGTRLVNLARRTPAERDRIHPLDAELYSRCSRQIAFTALGLFLVLYAALIATAFLGSYVLLATVAVGLAGVLILALERKAIRLLFRKRTGRDPRMESTGK